MVLNEKGYELRKAQAQEFEEAIVEFSDYAIQHPEIDSRLLKARENSLRTLLARINTELAEYEDKQLESLALAAKNYPKSSQERYKSLTKLTNTIQYSNLVKSQNIYSYSSDIFSMAWQQTLIQVFDKIDQYNPNKETVLQWFLSLLRFRLHKIEQEYLGSAEKVFRWGLGVGGWGVGFYPFSGGQLPNFQGKSP
ncbi:MULTISPECIES: hypothetical protein [unclassified Microcystis]|uniref:hypothetical protein n=1 Tax=unclassified Microcystis TaxID=2643300 RepID=UPI00119194CA|nr:MULTISPECIES: hypothetical protein [unclassified Microcystis]MCA2925528.1 hypothetical protein [Microcystis sp. M020S1]MCA2933298.1 hypothetical protein [Microcystis sp. M015S1]MCA2621345.1 hypothetical protein [Microcystis sp. M099S2]MCA2650273.1 hypothetical protein [Microcystis sp. M065S2]MCA2681857.1 hypothetical protein [Microcystis sp. M043S2]